MEIIIYGSKYGSAKKYAENLSEKMNIPCVSYQDVKNINDYSTIIYIGALYAGGVTGMTKTLKKISDTNGKKIIVVTVGISDPTYDKNVEFIRKGLYQQLPAELHSITSVFHLRGNIDYSRLSFMHRTMMRFVYKKVKSIPEEQRREEDKSMLETYNKKAEFIDFSSLDKMIQEIESLS